MLHNMAIAVLRCSEIILKNQIDLKIMRFFDCIEHIVTFRLFTFHIFTDGVFTHELIPNQTVYFKYFFS